MKNSNVYLLDSDILIALATPEHSLNACAAAWFAEGRRFAGVEATVESARLLLESVSSLPRHEFWPDDVSYLDMPTTGILGHRQVTDAYLVRLARKHGGSVATMDKALASLHAGTTLLA